MNSISIPLAVKMGRADALPEFIRLAKEAGMDIHAPDASGKTPLHIACMRSDDRSIEILLKHGANPNTPDGNGAMPLHIACQTGNIKCIKLLIDNGADVNLRDLRFQELPIHACYNGGAAHRFVSIRHLIEAGSEVNAKDRHHQTPLHYECNDDDTELVKIMLAAGADPNMPDVNKKTPLHLAIEDQKDIIATILLNAGANIHAKDIHGRSPLVSCIERRHPQLLEHMLELGMPRPMKTDLGYPLIDEVLSKRNKGVKDAQMILTLMDFMDMKPSDKIGGKSLMSRFYDTQARDLIKQAIRQERSETMAGSIENAMGDTASEDMDEAPSRSASASPSL